MSQWTRAAEGIAGGKDWRFRERRDAERALVAIGLIPEHVTATEEPK